MPKQRDPDLLEALGQRLQTLRKRAGLSQEALAEAVGIQPVTLSRYETGTRALSLTVLLGLAEAMGVSMSDLLDTKRKIPKPKLTGTVEEREILRHFRKLGDREQDLAVRVVREMTKR